MPNRLKIQRRTGNCLTDAESRGSSKEVKFGTLICRTASALWWQQIGNRHAISSWPRCRKGVLNETALFGSETGICPNHVIDYPDPNVAVARRLDMLPVEMVVRDYLTFDRNKHLANVKGQAICTGTRSRTFGKEPEAAERFRHDRRCWWTRRAHHCN